MDGLKLLAEARDAGLTVSAAADRLVIEGPRDAEAIATRLLANKAAVLAADWQAILAAKQGDRR